MTYPQVIVIDDYHRCLHKPSKVHNPPQMVVNIEVKIGSMIFYTAYHPSIRAMELII